MAAAILKDRHGSRRDFDGTLRAGAPEAEFDLPPSRSVSNILQQALMDPGAPIVLRRCRRRIRGTDGGIRGRLA